MWKNSNGVTPVFTQCEQEILGYLLRVATTEIAQKLFNINKQHKSDILARCVKNTARWSRIATSTAVLSDNLPVTYWSLLKNWWISCRLYCRTMIGLALCNSPDSGIGIYNNARKRTMVIYCLPAQGKILPENVLVFTATWWQMRGETFFETRIQQFLATGTHYRYWCAGSTGLVGSIRSHYSSFISLNGDIIIFPKCYCIKISLTIPR